MMARSEVKLKQLQQKIGGKTDWFVLDVTSSSMVDEAFTAALERYGRIDILVNNAGFGLFRPFLSLSEQEIEEMMDVNYFGMVRCTRARSAADDRARQRSHYQHQLHRWESRNSKNDRLCGHQTCCTRIYFRLAPGIGRNGRPRFGIQSGPDPADRFSTARIRPANICAICPAGLYSIRKKQHEPLFDWRRRKSVKWTYRSA